MKPALPLFTKILLWFFLNLMVVAAALAIFFAFQPHVDPRTIFGHGVSDRFRSAGMLIAHDLKNSPKENRSDLLARHAAIHHVDFTVVFKDGTSVSSVDTPVPRTVVAKAEAMLRQLSAQRRFRPLRPWETSRRILKNREVDADGEMANSFMMTTALPPLPPGSERKLHLMIKTRNPTRYWIGMPIPLLSVPFRPPSDAFLFAVSDSMTGKGFFFDPVPWIAVAAAVILISALFWIPMVRNITTPLERMTKAAEQMAKGCFDISMPEPRTDEIGQLAATINHMALRLSALVKGQKRFLGDVAHELGSPIARIQFGLGALEHRVREENRRRVNDVMEDVEYLSNLVGELLAFSRAEMSADRIRLERIALLPVVETAVKRENQPDARIGIEIDPSIQVLASSELLTRAVANLIRNALKYAKDAGPIHIFARKKMKKICLEVRDSGPGVPEELLDRVFEPFFRPEASRSRDSGGVGLGLAIVKTCVETCRGSVRAANLKPEGFAVTITLNGVPAATV